MHMKYVGAVALAAAFVAILLPSSAMSVARISDTAPGLADFDSRTGRIAPTHLQRALAAKLKVRVSWSRFGTPAAVSKRGTYLARGLKAL